MKKRSTNIAERPKVAKVNPPVVFKKRLTVRPTLIWWGWKTA
ncbi:MAG: hypothetical protein AAGF77_09935 [Bacteroidota bacterium]